MESRTGWRTPAVSCTLFIVLVTVAILTMEPFQTVEGTSGPAATYSHGKLHVRIPYQDAHAGIGQLTLEVLDPEDNVLGRSQRTTEISDKRGTWREEIKLDKALPIEDLVWHRVRYRFEYSEPKEAPYEGTESISQILRTPVVHILGQQSYLSGGPAAVRVIVTDSHDEVIGGTGSVRIDLSITGDKEKRRQLYSGRLNSRGTTEAQFRFPANLVGSYQLRYVVDTVIGSTEFTQQVKLVDKASILLTTEKPLYQPGQTIHARALVLDRANHEAESGRKFTFEVEDSRGNKVFKKATETDKFGVASAEFALADEVNLGTYHLRGLMDDADAPPSTAELALNIERYVLPKFKVAVDFAENGSKARHGYRPGDHVTGTVRANYFFGKPVDGAEVSVKGSAMDVAMFEIGPVQGKTNRDGTYHFDLTLPQFFAGGPLNQGAARVLMEASVKDSADHTETRGEPITVTKAPLLITAVPEGGTLVPNLENEVFVLTSYPDGTPARTEIKLHSSGSADQHVSSDEGGVAEVRITGGVKAETLEIEARDNDGNLAHNTVHLQSRDGEDQILLRTERAIFRAGDAVQLRVFSTKKKGTAYIDVIKEGQTILTRDVDLEDGQGELTLSATEDMAGTLDLNAYLFGRDARPVGDHRLVFVHPADELKIQTTSDSGEYKPGGEARIRFRVTNSRGQGVEAALGLQVVDEAVFALAEKQPGFAKVFFYLEQEVMKPRYEIHSIGMPDVVAPMDESKIEQKNRAARALFSATEMVNTNHFQTEFGRSVPMEKYGQYAERYRSRFDEQVQRLAIELDRAYRQNSEKGDLVKVFERVAKARGSDLRDPWGTEVRVEPVRWRKDFYQVRSAGVDHQFDTADDMGAYLEVRGEKRVASPSLPGTMTLTIEEDHGPFNGLAEIGGSVSDPTGAVIPFATVMLRETATGKERTTSTNPAGNFTLAALPPGNYEVKVFATGFQSISRKVTVRGRERAVLTATLSVGAMTQMVQVAAMNGVAFGVVGGVAGGVPWGQMGGVMGGPIARDRAFMVPVPPVAMPTRLRVTGRDTATLVEDESGTGNGSGSGASAHVRSYFPEALYINPEVITDDGGRASVVIPVADSITTWRMAMLASTTHGALGSSTSSIKVFQDFFVDLDLPVVLTQGDRVSIPVAVFNYSSSLGDVNLKLQADDWYSLVGDVGDKSVTAESGRVSGSQFTLEAKRIGKFKLTLFAQMRGAADRADIVVREIEIVPNGREQNLVFNGRLENEVQHEVRFPDESIPDASKIFVRLYPGPLSQVIEGMDKLLQMPYGCFEQTSSSTYPNVLALDYMKRTRKLTPEVHAKAEGYIVNGYQRLLTFEVPGGGFSWFGQAPANKILTSYGLMEFYDMSQVHEVDPQLIARTQKWLASQQQPDGSWKPDTQFINEGATNRYNNDVLRITAYIAWSLKTTGYQGPAVENARQFIEKHMSSGKLDTYTLAVLANFAADYGKDREFTSHAMELLLDARTEKDDQAWWTAEETSVYATGTSASVETTGLAVQALLKWGEASGVARKALSYLAAKKDSSGTWGTTQATIMALRALLLSTEKGTADVRGTLQVLVNGKTLEKLELTPDNNDLLHQFVFKEIDSKGANSITIRFDGKGGLAYQVVGSYFLPWAEKPANEPLSIDVVYDRMRLAQDDIATATATVKNNLPKSANMVMLDLGIPPGFDLLAEDLQNYLDKSTGFKSGRLEKFNMTATQAILYFDSIRAGDTVMLRFRLRAKYPIRARTFQSRVYEYYDPDENSVAPPARLEVKQR